MLGGETHAEEKHERTRACLPLRIGRQQPKALACQKTTRAFTTPARLANYRLVCSKHVVGRVPTHPMPHPTAQWLGRLCKEPPKTKHTSVECWKAQDLGLAATALQAALGDGLAGHLARGGVIGTVDLGRGLGDDDLDVGGAAHVGCGGRHATQQRRTYKPNRAKQAYR